MFATRCAYKSNDRTKWANDKKKRESKMNVNDVKATEKNRIIGPHQMLNTLTLTCLQQLICRIWANFFATSRRKVRDRTQKNETSICLSLKVINLWLRSARANPFGYGRIWIIKLFNVRHRFLFPFALFPPPFSLLLLLFFNTNAHSRKNGLRLIFR